MCVLRNLTQQYLELLVISLDWCNYYCLRWEQVCSHSVSVTLFHICGICFYMFFIIAFRHTTLFFFHFPFLFSFLFSFILLKLYGSGYETPTLTRTPDTTRTRTHEHLSNTSNSTWTRASLSCRCRCRVGHWTRLGAGVSVLHRAQAGKKKKEERILAIQ